MKKNIALLIIFLIFNYKNSYSAVTAPFTHNWDASGSTTHGWSYSSTNGGAGVIPMTYNSRSPSNAIGFSNDATGGTDKFTLSGVQNPGTLKLWIKCNSDEDEQGTLTVKWNNTIYGDVEDINFNLPYTEFTFDINQTGEGNLELIFNFTSGSTIYDVTIDDLSLTSNGPSAPTVSSVSVPSNGTKKLGDNLDFTVNWSAAVTTTGSPRIALTVGSTTKYATYQSGSTTTATVFRYTVESGDLDANGIAVGALELNSGTIKDGSSIDATLTLNSVGSTTGVNVDGVAPTVSNVSVPSNGTKKIGDNLDFTINWSENVTISGSPRIELTIGSTTKYATYQSGSTTSATVFRYTVVSGDLDADGIVVGALELNSGTIKDAATNDATLTLNSVGSTASVNVDGVVPTVSSVSVPSNGSYKANTNLDFTVNFSENVTINTPVCTSPWVLNLTIGSTAKTATYISGSGTSSIIFRYTVVSGDNDNDGIVIGAITTNGTTIRDAATNNATLTLNSVGSTTSVLVDTQLPALASAIIINDTSLKIGDVATVTITFTEAVTGFTTDDLSVANGVISNLTTSNGGIIWISSLTPNANIEDASNILTLDNTGYIDAAGNTGTSTSNSPNYAIDTKRPALASAITISDVALKIGETATVTFTFTEAVSGFTIADISVANGTLSNLTTGDGGITWTATLTPSASITDASNILTLDYTGLTDLNGNTGSGTEDSPNYAIDNLAPTVVSVSVPENNSYQTDDNLDFTINWSENITITGSPRIELTIGSSTKYATYQSGSTPSETVFRYTVESGDLDADGITVGALNLNSGTIKDGADNDATLTLNSIGSTSEVLVGGTAPEVVTNDVTNLGTTSATMNGEVISDGYIELSARGFVISSTETVPTLENATVYTDVSNTEGEITKDLSDLNPNTMYYYRAFATNSIATSYGEINSFATLAAEPTTQAKSITFHSITKNRIGLRWTKGDGSNRIVLASLYSLNDNSYLEDGLGYSASDFGVNTLTNNTDISIVYNSNGTSALVENLLRYTTYYFRIMEYNGSGVTSNYLQTTATGNPSSKATSKKESEENESSEAISIYPNPVKDILNIDMNLPFENATISIINEVGQEVYNSINPSIKLNINTLDFTNGVYHIIISNGNEMIYNSFVIER